MAQGKRDRVWGSCKRVSIYDPIDYYKYYWASVQNNIYGKHIVTCNNNMYCSSMEKLGFMGPFKKLDDIKKLQVCPFTGLS